MPSYALNQFMDVEDVLCQQVLSLDLREPFKTSPRPASTVVYKKSAPPCLVSGPATDARLVTSQHWTQHNGAALSSRWSRMTAWSERAVSMLEGDMGGLGWMSTVPVHEKPLAASSMNSVASSAPSLATAGPSSRYKTELCRTFTERGMCKYGGKCQFAHGPEELRGINRHPKYKTEPCRTFHSIGFCPYGIRCHFVHNNEDDQAPARPPVSRRPPFLRQSFSFSGFPSSLQPFLSTSSPPATESDLLTLAFPELDNPGEALSQFLPSPDSGCSLGELTPALSPSQVAASSPEVCPGWSPLGEACLGHRSQSLASLSDHEGGCSSSASSLSGCDLSASEGAGRRLPIFSQLSVPDDGSCGEGSTTSFFL